MIKNRPSSTEVIVKIKVARFLWTTVYIRRLWLKDALSEGQDVKHVTVTSEQLRPVSTTAALRCASGAVLRGARGPPPNEKCGPQCPSPILAQPT